MKHAYLIIAHAGQKDLYNLIRSIDDPRNDIYIHLDSKWKDCDVNAILKTAGSSKIFLTERTNVRWGGYSQIRAEMLLFEKAYQTGYEYYHLLSGQDICIKTQDEIHRFFEENSGKEFLCFCGKDWNQTAQERVKYNYIQQSQKKGWKLYFNRISKKLQALFGVNRLRHDKVEMVGGSNWVSITHSFCGFLLENKSRIEKRFARTFCADEIYKHTIAYSSRFREKVYLLHIPEKNDDTDPRMNLANMRLIDWVRGKPYLFTEEDFQLLKESPCLFARKVSAKNDLPEMILSYLKQE